MIDLEKLITVFYYLSYGLAYEEYKQKYPFKYCINRIKFKIKKLLRKQ